MFETRQSITYSIVYYIIVYELEIWSLDINTDFTLKDCLIGTLKLNKNSNSLFLFSYSGYGIGFDSRLLFLIQNFDFDKILFLV